MKLHELDSGDKCFIVSIKHHATLNLFAFALMDYFYHHDKNMDKISDLNKKTAEDILRTSLLLYGEKGIGKDIVMNWHGKIINDDVKSRIYERVRLWVITNYPQLK